MIPALIGTLIEFAPAIAGMFGGDDAEDMVSKVTDVARQVTGASDITHATQMLKASPEMQVAFQREANALAMARLEHETARLKEINQTMRAELGSDNKMKSYWRPFIGWVFGVSLALFILAIIFVLIYGVVKDPIAIGTFITSLSQIMGPLSVIWGMMLAVLGINISKRSQDKALREGHAPAQGLISKLLG